MKTVIVVIGLVFLLSSCKLTRVEGEVQDVEVQVSTKESAESDNPSSAKKCPPGLKKQGRCKD
ncbi:hypothetical protein HG263_01420 [Pseudoalteromonas sp. JBTF-M23]|uniref:Lipoprotein n=1 Tax=Pseudoalteromonas caenipelagi TaxID=2726988 RepID=A0A849V799_9GAMM|nr:hypothetical protein [Pseudoalteromonas caenipelagi]NOU49212.1 hypothetical protein [Pseudoalteromonas caenipelagi]